MSLPANPQVYIDTTYAPPAGPVHAVPAGGDLQEALNAANPGDTISLAAGATFTGPFTLPAKSGTGWVYIQGSAGTLPGTRISPAQVGPMPKILAPSSGSAIQTAPRAHHFRFVGIEFSPVSGQFVYAVVDLSTGYDFTFDRCYIHGDPTAGSRRGIAMNAASVAVIDSHLSDFKEVGADSQAITCWNGPGPYKIVNSYLEGAGENILFGGADPLIPNLVPSDIEIRGNHFTKPLSWMVGNPVYAGTHWEIKNLLELKNAQRVLIDGNVIEYNWPDAQNGISVLFTPRNQDGHAPWCIVQDVTFTHNIVRHVAGAFNILGWDNINTALQTQRILIRDNLVVDVGGSWTFGRLFQVLNGTANVTIDHNTALHTGDPVVAADKPNTGFVFTNNIVQNGTYGVGGDGTYGNPLVTLGTYFPGCTFAKNALVGGTTAQYPVDTYTPTTLAAVGFVNPSGDDYHLAASSPYKGAGTDGKDLGADIDAVFAATANAISGAGGVPPSPPPPSPPPPPSTGTLTITPTSVTFGSITVGATSIAAIVQVKNTGTVPVALTSVTASSPFVITQNSCQATPTWNGQLAPGTHCDVFVAFAPTTAGVASGPLTITGPLGVTLVGTLSGIGVVSPPLPPPPPPPPTKIWTGTVTATQDPTGKLTIAGLLT